MTCFGIVSLVSDYLEYVTTSAVCGGGQTFCESLYRIPEIELAIFGVVLALRGGILLLFHK